MGKGRIPSIKKRRERNELIGQEDASSGSSESDDRIVPPDGGWGWMVVLSSFMIHVIADGIVYSFGVFLMEFVVYFKSGRSAASLIGALQPAVTFTVGPIAGVLTIRYGCRKVTIAGAVIAAAGFVMSAFAPHLYYLYFTSGIMAGVGFGLIYLPAIVCVAQYFKKRRSFATGLAVCGSGFGTFILAPLIEMMVDEFSWQGAMLILGGVILNVIVCGVIFRPLKAGLVSSREMSADSESEALASSADMKNSVLPEHKNKRYILKAEDPAVNGQIMVEYPDDTRKNVTDNNRVFTNSRTVNINNSLRRLTTKTSDQTIFMAENNCSNSSNRPSTSTIEGKADMESPPGTKNTEKGRERAGCSEKEHDQFQGFKSRNNLHELNHTRGHNPGSSYSLDHLLLSQSKQDLNLEPRYSQSAVYILQSSSQSTPSVIRDSRSILSDPSTEYIVSGPQDGYATSSGCQRYRDAAPDPQDGQETIPNSHKQENTESEDTNHQDYAPYSQHNRYPSSKRHSSQKALSKLHAKLGHREYILSKLPDSSRTLSEQHSDQAPVSGDQPSQQYPTDFQKTQSCVSDPPSTQCLVSQYRHRVSGSAHSDSVLHLQLALRYRLRTDVPAPKSMSHSCLLAYKPLSRKDTLYSGTLTNFPLHRPKQYVYTTVTSVPDHVVRELSEKRDQKYGGCLGFSKDLCGALKDMMSLSLLRNPVFLMFAVSNFLTSLGFNVPFIFLPDRAKLEGIDEKSAALLLSCIGIANTVGRVVFGYLSDRPWVNRLMLYNTALTICGVVTALSPLVGGDYGLLVTYATIFGVFIGVYVSLTSIVLVDLLGLEYLTHSFGLLLLFQGAATFVGPPFAGWLCDWTGSYDISFIVMGSLVAVSGIMLYFLPLVERYHARRTGISDSDHDIELGQKPVTADDEKTHSKNPIISVV